MNEYRLPSPPSTNNLYLNASGRGRVLSPKYRAWEDQAGWQLKAQKPVAINFRARVIIDIDERLNGDCDNRAKPVLDLLVKHGVLKNDSKKYVQRVSIGWEPITGCRVRIERAA